MGRVLEPLWSERQSGHLLGWVLEPLLVTQSMLLVTLSGESLGLK